MLEASNRSSAQVVDTNMTINVSRSLATRLYFEWKPIISYMTYKFTVRKRNQLVSTVDAPTEK